jgi:molybdopterin-guanine dinucleotide biosynthesis protein A
LQGFLSVNEYFLYSETFLKHSYQSKNKQMSPLIGIVACGGNSSRMGQDKSLISYHKLPQRYHMYLLLKELCSDVVLSCNESQAKSIPSEYNYVLDDPCYQNCGPIAGLLSAHKKYEKASFLLIGCDYPYLSKKDIANLIDYRNETNPAISYYNLSSQTAEPLLALYEQYCFEELKTFHASAQYSLKRFLANINSRYVLPSRIKNLTSIDNPEQKSGLSL